MRSLRFPEEEEVSSPWKSLGKIKGKRKTASVLVPALITLGLAKQAGIPGRFWELLKGGKTLGEVAAQHGYPVGGATMRAGNTIRTHLNLKRVSNRVRRGLGEVAKDATPDEASRIDEVVGGVEKMRKAYRNEGLKSLGARAGTGAAVVGGGALAVKATEGKKGQKKESCLMGKSAQISFGQLILRKLASVG